MDDYVDADGVGSGGNVGSQGFSGFQPGDATNKNRNSIAGYVNVETDITPRLKFATALRGERFSDFGSTVPGQIAASYKASNSGLLRGSTSGGFRAPSLQQVYFSSTFTDFISGVPLDELLAANGGAIANAAGIFKLKEENRRASPSAAPTSST